MNIKNAGASYEYIPGSEVHDSTSFATSLSRLDLISADAFAYSIEKAMPLAAPAVEIALVRMAVWLSENPQFISNTISTISGAWNLGQILEKRSHNKGIKKSVNSTGQMPSAGGSPNPEPKEPRRQTPLTKDEQAIAYANIKSQLNRMFGKPRKGKDGQYYWFNEKSEPINIDRLHYDHYHILDKLNPSRIIREVFVDWRHG